MKSLLTVFIGTLIFYTSYTQNVGIGKTNPQAKLEIKQTSSLEPTVMLSDSVGGYGGRLRFRSLLSQYSNRSWYTDYKVGTYSKDNEIFLYNDSTNVMNIYGTGNITIGDAVTPDARLTILSDNPSSDILNIMGGSYQPALKITGDRNVGVGTPTPQQKLDVNGAIKVSTTGTNQPGTIRFNAGKFEGGDGANWKSFETLPSKAIILARTLDTTSLKLAGFDVFKVSNIADQYNDTIFTNNSGQWVGFPAANPNDEPDAVYNYESIQYNNRIIYYNADGTLYQYNIATTQWSQLPGVSPLSIREYFSMTLAGNEIYIFGGFRINPVTVYSDGAKYNLLTNTWSSVSNIPVGSFFHSSCKLENDIYVIGGSSFLNLNNQIELEKKLYKYNILTNSWSADLANSNTPFLSQGNAHSRNNKMLFVSDSIRQYDPALNAYSTLAKNISSSSYAYVSSLVQDKINVCGIIRDTAILSTGFIPYHSQIDLLNGQSTNLNICSSPVNTNNGLFTYRYVADINKFVYKTGSVVGGMGAFDPLLSAVACEIINTYNVFLYYMKKQ